MLTRLAKIHIKAIFERTNLSHSSLTESYIARMNDITDIFIRYIKEYGSVDIAESEFKKHLHEDLNMKRQYQNWCHESGYTEKNGFNDWAYEYLESQNEVWNNLNDFDEQ